MKPYIGLVHKDDDSAYGITFPDAPGCFSAADEIDEVFAMAEEALAVWTEEVLVAGRSVPPTRDLSVLRSDPEWESAFDDAALVIAVAGPLLPVREAA